MIFYTQTDITKSNTSTLNEVSIDELVKNLTDIEMEITIARMRNVKSISPDSYSHLKRQLPYFIGASFNGFIRNTNHFESIHHFVIDIDHYGNISQLEELKKKLSTDPRLLLAFISPGGDGIKLVFTLQTPISSTKTYSDFYKSFTLRFAKQYSLENVVDFKTSDATRICFMSHDENYYLNKNCERVNADLFVSDLDFFNTGNTNDTTNKIEKSIKDENSNKITDRQYKNILSTLNPKPPKAEKKYVVPEVLYALSGKLSETFQEKGFVIDHIADINYGRKFTVKDKNQFAVFNVYYGKRGFTVVKSPVRNSNEQLLDVCIAITEDYIYNKKNNKPSFSDEAIKEKQSYINDRIDEKN